MKNRHRHTASTLAFLDIMCCGLGAVVIIFIMLPPIAQDNTLQLSSSEVLKLDREILEGKRNLAEQLNTIAEYDETLATTRGRARVVQEEIEKLQKELHQNVSGNSDVIAQLQQQLKSLQQQRELQEQEKSGQNAMQFVGDGNRQYLTGLVLDGSRILILLDSSSSMLDSTIINILRRRNSAVALQMNAPKWQRAKLIVQWILANLPLDSDYQVGLMTHQTQSLTNNYWQPISDNTIAQQVLAQLQQTLPTGGHSLYRAFDWAMDLEPQPDNIFIVTDGLPTIDKNKSNKHSVSGKKRLHYFKKAVELLLPHIPINIILLPLEGDYLATGAFWELAVESRGTLLTPSSDWP